MPSNGQSARRIGSISRALVEKYAMVGWWPAEEPFEVVVGAVLVQNTRWANAQRAIARLRAAECLSSAAIARLPPGRLVGLLRPAGCQSVKAQRLGALGRWIEASGGMTGLRRWHTQRLRKGLLSVPGVGNETADAILCYAFDRPVFIADRYARRLFRRLGVLDAATARDYEACRAAMEGALAWSPARLRDLHAAIVRVSQIACRKEPSCARCGLETSCRKNIEQ